MSACARRMTARCGSSACFYRLRPERLATDVGPVQDEHPRRADASGWMQPGFETTQPARFSVFLNDRQPVSFAWPPSLQGADRHCCNLRRGMVFKRHDDRPRFSGRRQRGGYTFLRPERVDRPLPA
jgi:hypothetical protein